MPQSQWKLQGDYKPWYVGWSNCDKKVSAILQQYYKIPSFLPKGLNSGKYYEWIFMGTPGIGASYHIDKVNRPSWQAQVF